MLEVIKKGLETSVQDLAGAAWLLEPGIPPFGADGQLVV